MNIRGSRISPNPVKAVLDGLVAAEFDLFIPKSLFKIWICHVLKLDFIFTPKMRQYRITRNIFCSYKFLQLISSGIQQTHTVRCLGVKKREQDRRTIDIEVGTGFPG